MTNMMMMVMMKEVAVVAVVVVVMMLTMTSYVSGAPCCGPKQWVGEVRRVTMDTRVLGEAGVIPEWHWVSYDLDKQKVAVITFDPRPGNSELYRRELLDFSKGMHFVTPDEVKCTRSRLNGTMPRLCVPPSGGNITLDISKCFGVYPDPLAHSLPRSLSSASEFYRVLPNSPDSGRRTAPSLGDDSHGMFAESFAYEADDVIGHVTVTSLTCSFINEMTYTTLHDGSMVWQHTQWNNVTLTVDPESFEMPKSCYNATMNAKTSSPLRSTAMGLMMADIFDKSI